MRMWSLARRRNTGFRSIESKGIIGDKEEKESVLDVAVVRM